MCKDLWRFSPRMGKWQCMAKTIKEERLRWVKPIAEKRVKLVNVSKVCPHSKRSLERWVAVYKRGGEKALEPKATIPKTSPEETPIWIKERVITKRKKTKLCALKLHWRLAKEGLVVPVRTIGKILKQEGLTRKYRVKKMKYKYIRAERQPGEIVEIDVKYVPGKIAGRRYFQYTAIDVASRWRHLEIYDEQTNHHSICFLKEVMRRFDYPIAAIKTDNHATFTNRYNGSYKREDLSPRQMHALDQFCAAHNIVHYSLIRVNPLKMVLLKEVEDQEKFYEQNGFKNLEIWKESSKYGILTTTI